MLKFVIICLYSTLIFTQDLQELLKNPPPPVNSQNDSLELKLPLSKKKTTSNSLDSLMAPTSPKSQSNLDGLVKTPNVDKQNKFEELKIKETPKSNRDKLQSTPIKTPKSNNLDAMLQTPPNPKQNSIKPKIKDIPSQTPFQVQPSKPTSQNTSNQSKQIKQASQAPQNEEPNIASIKQKNHQTFQEPKPQDQNTPIPNQTSVQKTPHHQESNSSNHHSTKEVDNPNQAYSSPSQETQQIPNQIEPQVNPPAPQTTRTPQKQKQQDHQAGNNTGIQSPPNSILPHQTKKQEQREALKAIGSQKLKLKMDQCEEKDDKATCFEVGMIYYQGRSIYGQKLKEALYFFDRSCDSQTGLGCYEAGIIAAHQKQYPYAFIFLEKSCQSGDLRGCKNLGVLYYNGWGTPKNLYKATEIFNNGCKKGDPLACQKFYLALGDAYQESRNYEGAKKNFQKACEFGEKQACEKFRAIELLQKQLYYENVIENNVLKKQQKTY